MKPLRTYLSILLLALISLLISSYSNLQNSVIEDVKTAFSTGNVNAISLYINNNIELSFNGNKSIYSKSQSEVVLKNFFDKEKIQAYTIKKRSYSHNNNELYLISEYNSNRNLYIVYVSLILENNKYKINEISFQTQ